MASNGQWAGGGGGGNPGLTGDVSWGFDSKRKVGFVFWFWLAMMGC